MNQARLDQLVSELGTGKEEDDLEVRIRTSAALAVEHPTWSFYAAKLLLKDLATKVAPSFSAAMAGLGIVRASFKAFVARHAERLDAMVRPERDFLLTYFGARTLMRGYLLREGGEIRETPQYMWLRVACEIHQEDLVRVEETYALMSQLKATHATPTLFNAGTKHPQLSSCFLVAMVDDSIDGIYATLAKCAAISKHAGGIGLHVSNVRAQGTPIAGTGGVSNGIVPMLRVFNETARYVDQGGGKRKGSFAVYLEPWHADIEAFLLLKKNFGAEEARARDLFYALWVSDLFMQRVEQNGTWTLFCPTDAPKLLTTHSEEHAEWYQRYEKEGKGRKTLQARALWNTIVTEIIETGGPFLMFKDACNRYSNQRHLGVIRSSNLCTEIIQYSSPEETAVCNLASIALNRFAQPDRPYDLEGLMKVVAIMVRNLNQVIDLNDYPVPCAKRSNLRHRPIGLGVQGLADVYHIMRLAFDSSAAEELNRLIFEAMYFAALSESCTLAQEYFYLNIPYIDGTTKKTRGAHASFEGSPLSQGLFSFDLWGTEPSQNHDWEGLRRRIMTYGVRNSLVLAVMPTASTSQILGNNECVEPYTSNLYVRRTLAGEFPVVNPHLVKELEALGLWHDATRTAILKRRGSVQGVRTIPKEIQQRYKTAWEMKQKHILDQAAGRGPFIDQGQSLNVFMGGVTPQAVTSAAFYAFKKGLKKFSYYVRTQPAANAIQFTVCETCSA